RRGDAVPTPRPGFGRYRCCAGRALLEPMAMGRSRGTCCREREAALAGAAEGVLAVSAVAAETDRPGARAGWLHDEIEAGTASVRIFGALGLRLDCPDEAMGNDPSHCDPPCLLFRRCASTATRA